MSTEDGVNEEAQASDSNESKSTSVVTLDTSRGDVKASTIARMMGLMTVSDVALIESKVDFISTKVNNMSTRMDKVVSTVTKAPSGADFERLEAQIASLRTLIKELLGVSASTPKGMTPEKAQEHKEAKAIEEAEAKEAKAKREAEVMEAAAKEIEAKEGEAEEAEEAEAGDSTADKE